ncbi:peptidase M23 [Streptomyces cavernae]|uniref:peptidase M23 n=1 Tax=Streptomyces cavernae TaxID=2259034 RepID=UPI000FEBD5E5|nr:peptidase M23 [Streptomyces cavernae]
MNTRRLIKAVTAVAVSAGVLAVAPAASASSARPGTAAIASTVAQADGASATPSASTAAPAALPSVYIWAANVNVRHDGQDADCVFYPSRGSCPTVVATVSRTTASAHCQREGETIHDGGYSNRWWTLVELSDGKVGWVNNIYIRGGEKIAGVPDCAW